MKREFNYSSVLVDLTGHDSILDNEIGYLHH